MSKSLSSKQIVQLALKGCQRNAVNVILTASDAAVEGFCSGKCGTHGSSSSAQKINGKSTKIAYIWVGNSEPLCPGQCAWPFYQPFYGPQSPRLVAPNNDVGLDGMIIKMATSNFQGPKEAPPDAASGCPGFMAKDPIQVMLLVESATGASYDAHGVNGRKYLLPALFDPSTSTGASLV